VSPGAVRPLPPSNAIASGQADATSRLCSAAIVDCFSSDFCFTSVSVATTVNETRPVYDYESKEIQG